MSLRAVGGASWVLAFSFTVVAACGSPAPAQDAGGDVAADRPAGPDGGLDGSTSVDGGPDGSDGSIPVDGGPDGSTSVDGGVVDASTTDASLPTGTFEWRTVPMGGGGFVTGILAHPAADVTYARTDVGGAYRWDTSGQHWIPLLDAQTDGNYFGVASFAVATGDPDAVAMLVGRGTGMVLFSGDRGQTFRQAIAPTMASSIWMGAVDGNSRDARWGGERLAMADDHTLWVATRGAGLWKGTPSGSSWTWARENATGIAATSNVRAIALGGDGSLYAAVENQRVFRRASNGTWGSIGLDLSGPEDAIRMVVAGANVYVTTGQPSQLVASVPGRVWRYNGATWSDITPPTVSAPNGWGGLAAVGNSVAVAGNLQSRPPVMVSNDQGGSWRIVAPQPDSARMTRLTNLPGWWPLSWFADHTAGMAFDPRNPSHLWLTDWFGIWRTDDVAATAPVWQAREAGHEEVVTLSVDGVSGGALQSGVADVFGFLQTDPGVVPAVRDFTGISESVAGAYAPSDPRVRYRLVSRDGSSNGVIRFDGTAWRADSSFPDRMGYDIAVSATDPNLAVAVAFGGQPLRRDPDTGTWSTIASLMADDLSQQDIYQRDRPLAADGATGSVFYFYDRSRLWVSMDGGRTFSMNATTLPAATLSSVATPPGIAGEVWVALGGSLHVFTNLGANHTTVAGVSGVIGIAFGAPLPGETRPALYLAGDAGSGYGVYVSNGVAPITWRRVSDASVPMAKVRMLGASPDVPGRVFLGTSGRGVFYSLLH